MKKSVLFFLSILLIFIIIFTILNSKESFDNFNDNITIVHKLGSIAGFYSQLFFLINHYIFCKENKQNFRIDSSEWIYKSKNGWTDYFKPTELNFHNSKTENVHGHDDTMNDYSIESYKNAIPEIYVFNETVVNHIKNTKQILNLTNYDSIYIRRGDKLIDETDISQESIYVELLLKKNPRCKTIFLQTDDYTCFTNIQKYIIDKNLNIRVVTICNENNVGAITNKIHKENVNKNNSNNPENKEYISSISHKLQTTKSIEEMNMEEKYEHTLELLIGIDICVHSNICVCDFSSNVSRFIKLAHQNTNNVFDINKNIVDFSKKICPAYGF
jgi:hypothetical protein